MELWQMDITAGVRLSDGTEASIVTGIDDYSRFCVSAKVVARATACPVCDALGEGHAGPRRTRGDSERARHRLSLREQEFVTAARAAGASDGRILLRHLLPHAAGPISVKASVTVGTAVLAESALSFFGLGIGPLDTSLGRLVDAGQHAATTRPWLFYFPGLVILVIVLCVIFVGDGLRDALNPRG